MNEKWLPVVGYEGLYEVSDHGNVRSPRTGKFIAPQVTKPGNRILVMLWKEGKNKFVKVHRLVLFAFVGPPLPGQECCHNDGDASHNHVDNLRWDTASANQMDRVAHGTSNRGERCGSAKLTEEQVRAIRADNRLQREIAADYGIRASHVSRLKHRVRWSHI